VQSCETIAKIAQFDLELVLGQLILHLKHLHQVCKYFAGSCKLTTRMRLATREIPGFFCLKFCSCASSCAVA
jgi:hypothetical protein